MEQWWDEADVVICGERRLSRIQDRLENKKLTFYMSERWWKPPIGMARLLHPQFFLMAAQLRQLAKSPSFHYLPMGDYAADDMKKIAPFSDRMWNWGYFTAIPDPVPSIAKQRQGLRVLWAGRMLKFKRVDTLIKGFASLAAERTDATLTLVGDGPERLRLERLARKLLVAGSYQFLPAQPIAVILQLMRSHHTYVLPSNASEGWGAVVNEALSAGCVVIASSAAGAAKTMIEQGTNGFLFEPGDYKSLAEQLLVLSRDEKMQIYLAENGQRTVRECWSPAVAGERFFSVTTALLKGSLTPKFHYGPMSSIGF